MITITFNPDWPEIKNNILPHQTALDRPDLLCARVFKLKCAQIHEELYSGKVLGKPIHHNVMAVIETRKRGLPHQHHLVIVKFEGDGLDAEGEMDSWVWAQLPPATLCNGKLRELVMKFMVHRKCGSENVNAPCMEVNKKINKKFCDKHLIPSLLIIELLPSSMINLVVQNTVDQATGILKLFVKTSTVSSPPVYVTN